MLRNKQFFMRDQAQFPVAAFMSEAPRRAAASVESNGVGVALFVVALTMLNIIVSIMRMQSPLYRKTSPVACHDSHH